VVAWRSTFKRQMQQDFSAEITFKTSRSSGSGGQHVNKVETAVEGIWYPALSQVFTEVERDRLLEQLAPKLSKEGSLRIRAQQHRSQLANKLEVLEKFRTTVARALHKPMLRIATRPTASSREKRLEQKKQKSAIKKLRQNKPW
jgi:ribosome-associated protein